MAVVMVLHAEGPGDLGRPSGWIAPGYSLLEDDLGPAHELVRRILSTDRGIPPTAVDFREPLRTRSGARAHGSKLLAPRVLDEVLGAWIVEVPLVVLLVDGDEQEPAGRRRLLREALDRNGLTGAVGVAIREFESWLIADQEALDAVLGPGRSSPADIEGLDPRVAKERLTSWTSTVAGRSPLELRQQLATTLDLDQVRDRCPSFAAFREELAALDLD